MTTAGGAATSCSCASETRQTSSHSPAAQVQTRRWTGSLQMVLRRRPMPSVSGSTRVRISCPSGVAKWWSTISTHPSSATRAACLGEVLLQVREELADAGAEAVVGRERAQAHLQLGRVGLLVRGDEALDQIVHG